MSVIEDRIYIGNVDYNVTEDELRDFFANTGVKSIEIPSKTWTRGDKEITRRLGFVFVLFDTKEAADKAVEDYNDKQFKDRKIFVKKALPPPTEEEKAKKGEEFRAKRAAQKAAKEAAAVSRQQHGVEGADGAVVESSNGDSTASTAASGDVATGAKKRRARKPKKKATAAAGSESASSEGTANGAETSPEGTGLKVPEGSPSPDTIFITNLHYRVQQRTISNVFKELKPKWVHVPLRRVPYRNRKTSAKAPVFNKGIAFVKFANHDVQQEAINKFNGHEIEGRAIIVEVAIDTKERDVEEIEADSKPELELLDAAEAQTETTEAAVAAEGATAEAITA